MTITAYRWTTRHGLACIAFDPKTRRWDVLFEDQNLGSYPNAQQAADDFATGSTYWPSEGNPADWGVPEDLSDWTPGVTPLR